MKKSYCLNYPCNSLISHNQCRISRPVTYRALSPRKHRVSRLCHLHSGHLYLARPSSATPVLPGCPRPPLSRQAVLGQLCVASTLRHGGVTSCTTRLIGHDMHAFVTAVANPCTWWFWNPRAAEIHTTARVSGLQADILGPLCSYSVLRRVPSAR